MSQIVQSLTPIIVLVALGAVMLRFRFYADAFRRGLDRLVYWIALPALIVAKLSQAGAIGSEAGKLFAVLSIATAGALVAGYLVAWLMRLPGSATGALVQAAFRGNLAFVGLPVIVLAAKGDTRASALAALVLGPMVAVYNVAAVVVLLLGQHRMQWSALPRVLKSLLTNPLLLSCVAGVLLALMGWRLPGPIESTLGLLGQTAAPLALLSLGGTLIVYPMRAQISRALAAAVIKVGLTPALAYVTAMAFGLTGMQTTIVMIFAATPTAVASYVLAGQLQADEGLAASSIVVSTLLSAVSLAVALAL